MAAVSPCGVCWGTPVVAYETGGLPDMVRKDASGSVVNPVGNSAALAEAISKLLFERGKLPMLRRNARDIAVAEYDLGIQSRNYKNFYEKMCFP